MAASSFSVDISCPRFLNMNTSRSFFETASVLSKVISQSNPDTFREIIFERDINYIRGFWNIRDQSGSGVLTREDTLAVLHSVTELYWKDEVKGLSPDQTNHFLLTFCNLADIEGNGIVSFDNLVSAFKMYTSRCYFSGSKEILVKNNIGKELKASTKDLYAGHLQHSSMASESEYRLLDTFISIANGNSAAIPLSGKLSIMASGYKIVNDVSVSPHQMIMLPLKHRNKRRRKKGRRSASGFRYSSCLAQLFDQYFLQILA